MDIKILSGISIFNSSKTYGLLPNLFNFSLISNSVVGFVFAFVTESFILIVLEFSLSVTVNIIVSVLAFLSFVDDTFAIFLKEAEKDTPYFAGRIDDITKFQ